jgi:hypothetical protein
MPFSKTSQQRDEKYWESFYNEFLEPSLASWGYKAEKSVDTPNNITKKIVRELAMADLVLAVLTDGKPNVLYELGVRHSLREGTIMILEGDERPFDINHHGILSYRRDQLEKFKIDLGRYIAAAERREEDSPVADFLNQRITIGVNLAIARLRQCVEILKVPEQGSVEDLLQQVREIQKTWSREKEQVSVVRCGDNTVVLHLDRNLENKPAEECFYDALLEGKKSLYPQMKERRSGFRITQIDTYPNRLTAIAYERLNNPDYLVIAEAHYYQESRPY